MDLERGMIVRSKAGRDKGTWLMIWAVEGDTVLLVDGDRRPMENPKRKKRKHCQTTQIKVILPGDILGNKTIRRLLKEATKDHEPQV